MSEIDILRPELLLLGLVPIVVLLLRLLFWRNRAVKVFVHASNWRKH